MYNLVLNKEACNCSNNTKSINSFSNKSLLGTACSMQNDIFSIPALPLWFHILMKQESLHSNEHSPFIVYE